MRALGCVIAVLLVLGLAAPAAAGSHEALMQEVEAFGDKVTAAMLANDVETMLAMYAEDAISLPNYGPRMQGIEAFRLQHEQMKAAGMEIHSFEGDPTEVWQAGDQVIEIGTFNINLTVPGMPQPITDVGKYMTVYVRDAEGALKIKAEIWNTDMNPMEMGSMGMDEAPAEATPPAAPGF